MRTVGTLAVSVLAVLCAPAVPASAQQQNPLDVIDQLELSGYTVNIDRIGSAPLQDCTVTEVRNPQQVVEPVTVIGRDRDGDVDLDTVNVIVRQTISVSLDCTG